MDGAACRLASSLRAWSSWALWLFCFALFGRVREEEEERGRREADLARLGDSPQAHEVLVLLRHGW